MGREKLGLILDGGGARGAYQIGALRALEEKGYHFDGIVGTSIGALNGAMFCQDELTLAQKIWENLDYKHVFAYEDKLYDNYEALMRLDVKSVDFSLLASTIVKIVKDGGLDNEPMKRMIRENLKEDVIRASGCDFGMVTVNVSDMKAEELFIEAIPNGALEDYILASAYVPVFKRSTFNGKSFLDGGFYDNSPVNMLLNKGYKEIIVIKLGGRLSVQRAYEATDAKIHVIEPREELGDLLEFDLKRIRYNLQLGYFDGIRFLENLKGYKYYIKNLPDSQRFIQRITQINREDILTLKSVWPSSLEDDHRYMFEVVTNKVAKLFKLPSKWDYDTLFPGIIEYFMAKLKKSRFKIYDWDELNTSMMTAVKVYKKEQSYEVALEMLLRILINPKD